MKSYENLIKDQEENINRLEDLRVQLKKQENVVRLISDALEQTKKDNDIKTFKFVSSNFSKILKIFAPKHILPKPREISVPKGKDESFSIKAKVPYSKTACSDVDNFNIGVCPRCTMLHFSKMMERILASHYSE